MDNRRLYFDTHAHYDDRKFGDDREELLSSLPEKGIRYVLNPGSSVRSSRQALKLAEKYPFLYAAAGVHPHEAEKVSPADYDELRTLAKGEKVLAIGEIGLDYHYNFSPRDVQKIVFRNQMELASELNLPVIIHDREAHADCLEILSDYPEVRGVCHCYTGSLEHAKRLLKLGYLLSFTGVVTFKNAWRAGEIISYLPEDRLMLETDAPYMTPEPFRGKRNDSGNLPLIAEKIAEIRGVSAEKIAELTLKNGVEFFRIPRED